MTREIMTTLDCLFESHRSSCSIRLSVCVASDIWLLSPIFLSSFVFPHNFLLVSVSAAIFLTATICSVGFPLVLALGLDPPVKELLVGLFFFLASMFMMLVYFGPRTYLLLTGADLNNKLQIVRSKKVVSPGLRGALEYFMGKGKDADGADSGKTTLNCRSDRASGDALVDNDREDALVRAAVNRFMLRNPETVDDCQRLVAHLQKTIMDLNMKSVNGASSLFDSHSHSRRGSSHRSITSTHNGNHLQQSSCLSEAPVTPLFALQSKKVPLLGVGRHSRSSAVSVAPCDGDAGKEDDEACTGAANFCNIQTPPCPSEALGCGEVNEETFNCSGGQNGAGCGTNTDSPLPISLGRHSIQETNTTHNKRCSISSQVDTVPVDNRKHIN
jgi:hypothetical protein